MSSEPAPEEITLFPEPSPGKVEQTIATTQPGRVEFQATYWPARFYHCEGEVTLVPDDPVMVVGRQGITLLVVPVSVMPQANLQDGATEKGKVLDSAGAKNAIASSLSAWTQKFSSILRFWVN